MYGHLAASRCHVAMLVQSARRRFAAITSNTLQLDADEARASLFGRHPFSDLPRRIVPDVLVVAALQLGHPVAFFVVMIAGDPALHRFLDVLAASFQNCFSTITVIV